jgi:hypothetical protein
MKTTFKKLSDVLKSHELDSFLGDKLGNDLFINDPERADRIIEAAENGCDGSTHQEHIEDWREFMETLTVEDDDTGDITSDNFDSIMDEILACEAWHEKNGSLNAEIS